MWWENRGSKDSSTILAYRRVGSCGVMGYREMRPRDRWMEMVGVEVVCSLRWMRAGKSHNIARLELEPFDGL